jgi:hypothetical protein
VKKEEHRALLSYNGKQKEQATQVKLLAKREKHTHKWRITRLTK